MKYLNTCALNAFHIQQCCICMSNIPKFSPNLDSLRGISRLSINKLQAAGTYGPDWFGSSYVSPIYIGLGQSHHGGCLGHLYPRTSLVLCRNRKGSFWLDW